MNQSKYIAHLIEMNALYNIGNYTNSKCNQVFKKYTKDTQSTVTAYMAMRYSNLGSSRLAFILRQHFQMYWTKYNRSPVVYDRYRSALTNPGNK